MPSLNTRNDQFNPCSLSSPRSVAIERLESRQLLSATLASLTITQLPRSTALHLSLEHTGAARAQVSTASTVTTARLARVTPGKVLAGKNASTVLVIHNPNKLPETGTLNLNLVPSQDGTNGFGGFTLITVSAPLTVKGRSSSRVPLKFTVPSNLPGGQYTAIASGSFAGNSILAVTPAKFRVVVPPQPVTTPSLVGHFVGTVKPNGGGLFGSLIGALVGKQTIDLNITSQAIDSLGGTVKISSAKGTGTLMGRELSNGNFHYTLNTSDFNVTLDGHVRADGMVLSGTISGTFTGFSFASLKGTFQATRQAT
jgi:hypothetical protein